MINKLKENKTSFTLVEVMIVAGVSTILLFSILCVLGVWHRSWSISQAQMDVEFQARRIMRAMTEELSQSSPNNLTVGANNDTLTFQIPSSYSGGNISWGDSIQYSLGGVVNHQLLRTNLNTSQIEVLGSYVDSLLFDHNSDIIDMQITVNRTIRGNNAQRTLGSQVSLRNR